MAFKIYTKTGDKGETSLFGGRRLPKYHLRIDTYGTVDELNAFIGLVSDHVQNEKIEAELKAIQDLLFVIGANLAADPEQGGKVPDLKEADILFLEQAIDQMEATLPALKHFILPGGHPAVSFCHVARCVCRRAERLVVALAAEEVVLDIIIRYLNRLSDYLFVLARKVGHDLGIPERKWEARKVE